MANLREHFRPFFCVVIDIENVVGFILNTAEQKECSYSTGKSSGAGGFDLKKFQMKFLLEHYPENWRNQSELIGFIGIILVGRNAIPYSL